MFGQRPSLLCNGDTRAEARIGTNTEYLCSFLSYPFPWLADNIFLSQRILEFTLIGKVSALSRIQHCVIDRLPALQEDAQDAQACAVLCCFVVLSLCFRFKRESLFSPSSHPAPYPGSTLDHALSPNSIQAIRNNTLGFGDIYFINMPGRTDKLDALRLFTSLTNISYTVVPGVDGNGIPHVAWPGFYKEDQTSGTGSWRAHMNAAASILDNNLSSALIFEDDAD